MYLLLSTSFFNNPLVLFGSKFMSRSDGLTNMFRKNTHFFEGGVPLWKYSSILLFKTYSKTIISKIFIIYLYKNLKIELCKFYIVLSLILCGLKFCY